MSAARSDRSRNVVALTELSSRASALLWLVNCWFGAEELTQLTVQRAV
jgi:hypothetical protein